MFMVNCSILTFVFYMKMERFFIKQNCSFAKDGEEASSAFRCRNGNRSRIEGEGNSKSKSSECAQMFECPSLLSRVLLFSASRTKDILSIECNNCC